MADKKPRVYFEPVFGYEIKIILNGFLLKRQGHFTVGDDIEHYKFFKTEKDLLNELTCMIADDEKNGWRERYITSSKKQIEEE